MSTSWRMPVSPATGCSEHSSRPTTLARPFPAAGLVHEAREGAQLRLAAKRVMEAQISGGLRHQGVERGIAGEAKDVVLIVVLSPFHRLDPPVVAVAAPHDASLRPMSAQALRHMLDDGTHLGALGGARRAQNRRDRSAARNVIDVHRCKTALVVMRVPERKLLAPMRRAERVVNVEDLQFARLHARAELIK